MISRSELSASRRAAIRSAPRCAVKDVAAHVISAPQLTWRETAKVLPQMLRHGYDGAIARDGRRRSAVPTGQLLADYERWAPVRRGPATVTDVEPLIDVLVHTQDILRPLGRHHAMPVEPAVVAAQRSRLLAPMMGAGRVRRLRLVATDADWSAGPAAGPRLEGPVEELLMVLSGRPAREGALTGPGLADEAVRVADGR